MSAVGDLSPGFPIDLSLSGPRPSMASSLVRHCRTTGPSFVPPSTKSPYCLTARARSPKCRAAVPSSHPWSSAGHRTQTSESAEIDCRVDRHIRTKLDRSSDVPLSQMYSGSDSDGDRTSSDVLQGFGAPMHASSRTLPVHIAVLCRRLADHVAMAADRRHTGSIDEQDQYGLERGVNAPGHIGAETPALAPSLHCPAGAVLILWRLESQLIGLFWATSQW